jgi:threonine synthase
MKRCVSKAIDLHILLSDAEQILKTIRSSFEAEVPYVVDPHTAVGLAAAVIISRTK